MCCEEKYCLQLLVSLRETIYAKHPPQCHAHSRPWNFLLPDELQLHRGCEMPPVNFPPVVNRSWPSTCSKSTNVITPGFLKIGSIDNLQHNADFLILPHPFEFKFWKKSPRWFTEARKSLIEKFKWYPSINLDPGQKFLLCINRVCCKNDFIITS